MTLDYDDFAPLGTEDYVESAAGKGFARDLTPFEMLIASTRAVDEIRWWQEALVERALAEGSTWEEIADVLRTDVETARERWTRRA